MKRESEDSAHRRRRERSRSHRRGRDPPPRDRSRSHRRARNLPRGRSRSRRRSRDPAPPPRGSVRNAGSDAHRSSDSHRQIVKQALTILPGKWECQEKSKSQVHTVSEANKSRDRGHMTCETWEKEPEGNWRFKKSFAIYVSLEKA